MDEKDRERRNNNDDPGSPRPGAHSSSLGIVDRRRRAEEHKNNIRSLNPEPEVPSRARDKIRTDEETDAKRKAANGSDAGDPSKSSAGAQSVFSRASDRAKRKEERHRQTGAIQTSTTQGDEPAEQVPLDESYQVEATAVNDDEADERVRRLEEQMAAMIQGASPAVAVVNANSEDEESDDEYEDMTFFQRYRCGILIVLALVAIGGGVAGYLLGTQGSESSSTAVSSRPPYNKPNAENCARVAEIVVETDDKVFVDLTFVITLVPPSTTAKIQATLVALTEGIDTGFIPLLVGCPSSSTRRRLQSDDLRYLVADAVVQPAFQEEDPDNVFKAVVPMEVYLRGEEQTFLVGDLIQTVFNDESGAEALSLPSDTVNGVLLQNVWAGRNSPDLGPVSAPTQAPVLGPTQPPLDATSRRNLLESLLNGRLSIQPAALNWLSNVDTWQPASGSATESQQWIERYAMVVFYNATNGDNWSNNAGWLSSTSVCGWSGIDACTDDLIADVELGNIGLSGTIPSEIGLLTELTSLRTGYNGVSGQIPTEIGNLLKLQDISISQSDLSGSIPTEIARLTRLSYLSLWDTSLSGTIPALPSSITYFYVYNCNLVGPLPSIGQLSNLLQFEVEENSLTGRFPEDLELLTRMEHFTCFTNSISGSIPTSIGKMTSLVNFVASSMSLTGTIPTEIGLLTKLTDLELYFNNIVGSIPIEVGQMTSLKLLKLDNNRLVGSIPTEIGLLNLRDLDLYSNSLTGTIPTEIGNLRQLEELELDKNPLSGTIPTEIGLLTNMWDLGLYETNIGGSIPTEIGLATSLELLILYDTFLVGTLPTELGNLVRLRELRPFATNIGGPIPREIGRLTSLTSFDMDDCGLTGQIPSDIINLSLLEELYLDGNELSGDVPPLPSTITGCELQGNCFSGVANGVQLCSVKPNYGIGGLRYLVADAVVQPAFIQEEDPAVFKAVVPMEVYLKGGTGTLASSQCCNVVTLQNVCAGRKRSAPNTSGSHDDPKSQDDIIHLYLLAALDQNELSGAGPPLPSSLSVCELHSNCFSDIRNVPQLYLVGPNDCR